jgi:uncharacterized phage protein (TIGR02218 family)
MRVLPQGLAEHLATGATTLCHCWRLDLRSGEAMGFTDHDRALSFDGLTFEAETGFTASEIDSSLGLSVDNLEASGALSSGRISEARIAAGEFDDAEVHLWRVNWQEVSQRLLLKRGRLGEVTRGPHGFAAELRGMAHRLNQPQGRIFQYGCDAELGDARCGVDLADPDHHADALVTACEGGRVFRLEGIADFEPGFFARGRLHVLTGANAGRWGQVKFHRAGEVELWQAMAEPVQPGTRVRVTAGCDRQFGTCRDRFMNAANFRGFPHMPGDDFVMRYATREDR